MFKCAFNQRDGTFRTADEDVHRTAAHAHETIEHVHEVDEHAQKADEHVHEADEHAQKADEHVHAVNEHAQKVDEHAHEVDEHVHRSFEWAGWFFLNSPAGGGIQFFKPDSSAMIDPQDPHGGETGAVNGTVFD